jgi:hypothetical protein
MSESEDGELSVRFRLPGHPSRPDPDVPEDVEDESEGEEGPYPSRPQPDAPEDVSGETDEDSGGEEIEGEIEGAEDDAPEIPPDFEDPNHVDYGDEVDPSPTFTNVPGDDETPIANDGDIPPAYGDPEDPENRVPGYEDAELNDETAETGNDAETGEGDLEGNDEQEAEGEAPEGIEDANADDDA